jgi:molybdate transport system ATP-binding protein
MSGAKSQGGVQAEFDGLLGRFRLKVSLHIPPKGITALVGPSGAGKTSLLRAIAGLTRLPGKVVMDGEVWQEGRRFVPVHQRALGMVFQESSLLSHLSVKDNLMFGFRRTLEPKTMSLDEVVPLLGLEPLIGRSTDNLSGGERQRVALGRALLSQPRLLLMDEPLSSLDAQSRADILPFLEALHRTLSIPVLYVSHDAEEVARLADHVVSLKAGQIIGTIQQAKPDTLSPLSTDQIKDLARQALEAGIKPNPSVR